MAAAKLHRQVDIDVAPLDGRNAKLRDAATPLNKIRVKVLLSVELRLQCNVCLERYSVSSSQGWVYAGLLLREGLHYTENS